MLFEKAQHAGDCGLTGRFADNRTSCFPVFHSWSPRQIPNFLSSIASSTSEPPTPCVGVSYDKKPGSYETGFSEPCGGIIRGPHRSVLRWGERGRSLRICSFRGSYGNRGNGMEQASSDVVPLAGLGPARFLGRGILSPLCLPIPPQRRVYSCVFYHVPHQSSSGNQNGFSIDLNGFSRERRSAGGRFRAPSAAGKADSPLNRKFFIVYR